MSSGVLHVVPAPPGFCERETADRGSSVHGDLLPPQAQGTQGRVELGAANPSLRLEKAAGGWGGPLVSGQQPVLCVLRSTYLAQRLRSPSLLPQYQPELRGTELRLKN